MYTNTIIGSYNAIANSEHGAMIMKPPIRRQPKKSHSKDKEPHGHCHNTSRGNSEEGQNSILSPGSQGSVGSPLLQVVQGPCLAGLEVLGAVGVVWVEPDKIFSPEVSKIGFTIAVDTASLPPPTHRRSSTTTTHRIDLEPQKECTNPGTTPILRCVPSETTTSRALSLETLDGKLILQLHTHTPYCCSWYQDLEAKISLPSGNPFGSIEKTAFGPCKCNRRFVLSCRKDGGVGDNYAEKVQFTVETVINQKEVVIKQDTEIVAKVTLIGLDCRTAYKVTFLKDPLCSTFKALFVVFAINLHIAFAEKLNTCFGMGLCGVAGSSVAAWILCLL